MPIYQLGKELVFPHPLLAEDDGILAIGGDLSAERLLLAYANGIFPWYNADEPIVWHAPNPRFVLFPEKFKASKSLKQLVKKQKYTIKTNTCFEKVIENCKTVYRPDQEDTWIDGAMQKAYTNLHHLGYAHSVEVFNAEQKLVGGLYGVQLGQVFYGESMFHLESNTSKLAFHYLVNYFNIKVIDCQMHTKHLESLGGEFITMERFLSLLKQYTK